MSGAASENKVEKVGRIIILGAGPCGLGVAYRLHELGHTNFFVFEREDRVGGLAASYRDPEGFTWDCGVHVLYSKSSYFNAVMDKVFGHEWHAQRRDAQIWMLDRFVPYPLQYNVHRLPESVCRECVLGLTEVAKRNGECASFLDWILNSFGSGIARHFMVPYNEKLWAIPLDCMSHNWIAERVPQPNLDRVLSNLNNCRDDDSWGPNAYFHYPKSGGTGALWERVAERIPAERFRMAHTAKRIDTTQRRVFFEGESYQDYDVLVSTMPLNRLVEIAELEVLREPAAMLKSTIVHVIGIGVAGETPSHLLNRRWIYFPDASVPFYRASVLSNFSPSNAPAGHWSVLAEISESQHRRVDRAQLADAVIAGAIREGLLENSSRIASRWHRVLAPGYPTPTKSRDRALEMILPNLEELRIYSRGRFGIWKYEISNQDHSFVQGVELAERLVLGSPERLLNNSKSAASG
jgi:protoporphyrinogen oxidase